MRGVVHSLWIGPSLPRLQRLCMESWIRLGYEYRLFVYGDVENLPTYAVVIDGSQVIKEIHRYQDEAHKGHPALHANYFRYVWLYEEGGIWADLDCALLRPLPNKSLIISSEPHRAEPYWFPDLALIKIPPKSDLMRKCRDKAKDRIDRGVAAWGKFGPKLLIKALQDARMNSLEYVSPPRDFCPIPCWLTDEIYRPHALPLPRESYGFHIWSESSKARGHATDERHHPDSLFERLWHSIFEEQRQE